MAHIKKIIQVLVLAMLGTNYTTAKETTSLKELFLTPGDLNAAHAHLKGKCAACHVEFTRASQDQLCTDCHEEIRTDIKTKLRFHGGFFSTNPNASCGNCHTEHQGEDGKITTFDVDLFDHGQTSFALDGRHAIADCKQCHNDMHRKNNENKGFYRIEHHSCTDCHEDAHQGALGQSCADCHGAENWKAKEFDHASTAFPLVGAHVQTTCAACHRDMRFGAPKACRDCHQPADPHRGAMGTDCGKCHNAKSWQQTSFNHDRTRFPLHGRHEDIACELCHNSPSLDLDSLFVNNHPVKGICADCHRTDDIHEGAYGNQCSDCHSEKSWRNASFDHNRRSSFKIEGLHRSIACVACHEVSVPVERTSARNDCIDCHKADDIHNGSLGERCNDCHLVKDAWKEAFFDHDFTDFPLTGLHRILPCAACHASNTFDAPLKCDKCHLSGDAHKDVFVDRCETCHNTADWPTWRFDHATTEFPLEGAHEPLGCMDCHTPNLADPVNPGKMCNSCHAKDDVHDGGFGARCEKCHTQTTFEVNSITGGAR